MRPRYLLLAATAALTACHAKSPGVTTPTLSGNGNPIPCGGSGVVSLATYQDTTIDCNSGNEVTLAAHGASYLVVPQLAAGDVADQATSYVIGASVSRAAVASADRAPVGQVSSAELGGPAFSPGFGHLLSGGLTQARFDAELQAQARNAVLSGRWRPNRELLLDRSAGGERPASFAPALNSIRSFRVLATMDTTTQTFKTVAARLDYIGTNVLLYVDTMAPPAGLSSSSIQSIGDLFDQTLYPLDLQAFGEPTDIDNNGHVIMLMSPVVNSLTPASQCASQGFLVGFFDGIDLAGAGSKNSNDGEIIYTIVPDPNGTVSCPHSLSDFLFTAPPTFLHEVQHLISFSQHVLIHGGAPEDGWLDEGLSLVAEELGSIYYEKKFPPPTGRTNPNQLFPDSAEGFITDLLLDSYGYLQNPGNESITTHSDADIGLNWRGGDWLLARWLGDHYGEGVYKQLDESTLTGISNIEAATGSPFPTTFGHLSLSFYTDSIPGLPRDSIPLLDRFTSRNLRQLYAAVYRAAGPSATIPTAFPITVTSLGRNGMTASLKPGSMTFYSLNSSPDSATVTIRFGTASGNPLGAALNPQISIFRLPQ